MDPNDPDGSYDMCLSRPGTMLSLCKIPLNNCGIDAASENAAATNPIWDFVVARLAAMRVDSCTTEVKNCLQSDDRCGEDYANCIGLDTDTIIRMCPYDKLTGCQKVYGETEIRGNKVYDELATMIQGIMLNIDNNFLTLCQNAANEAMIKVCGDTANCNSLAVDDGIGSRSLEYKICEYKSDGDSLNIDYNNCRTDISQIQDKELGRIEGATSGELGPVTPFAGVLDGTIYWESVEIGEDGLLSTVDEYMKKIDSTNMGDRQKELVKSELAVLQRTINTAIQTIEADPTVQYCMTGRQVQGMALNDELTKVGRENNARFPDLTKQMRSVIANAALQSAKGNYYKKYDELNEKMLQDYATIGERVAEIQGENALDARREIARQACVGLADMSSLPMSPKPPKSDFAKIATAVMIMGAVAAIPFTGGASALTLLGSTTISASAVATATAAAAGAAGVLGATSLAINKGKSSTDNKELDLVGSKQLNQWNFKQTITSTFEWETLKCEKCTRSQHCTKTKRPLFGDAWCKTWGNEVNSCEDIQF